MTINGWVYISICAISAAVSSFILRVSIDRAGGFTFNLSSVSRLFVQPLFIVGVFLYAVAGLAWFRVIATEHLNIAYPVMISVTFILAFIGAAVLFEETVTIPKLLGLSLIIFGIFLVSRG
jgi:multidrug transporter EmrE-like cation transporter